MTISVRHLFETPQHRPAVARWIYEAFWQGSDEFSPATFDGYLREAVDADRIPLSLLAFVEGRPAGTVNLVHDDVFERPGLHPWLAALYVIPEFRLAGVGSALVRSVSDHAVRLGVPALYLGTNIPKFYARFGASIVDRDRTLRIMRLPVGSGGTPHTKGTK